MNRGYMKIEEAKKKWCRYSIVSHGWHEAPTSINRSENSDPLPLKGTTCLTTRCMHWEAKGGDSSVGRCGE